MTTGRHEGADDPIAESHPPSAQFKGRCTTGSIERMLVCTGCGAFGPSASRPQALKLDCRLGGKIRFDLLSTASSFGATG
jgi:hypothetical protein